MTDESQNEYIEINIDQEFWGDFIQEAFEHVEDIETNVIDLEQHPDNMEIIHTMFRAFHTIKGLSGFVEHTIIQEIAHKTETMMDLCRKQELKVNKDIVDAILKSADYIKHLCEDMDSVKEKDYVKEINVHCEVLEKLSETTVIKDEIIKAEISENKNEEIAEPIDIDNLFFEEEVETIAEVEIEKTETDKTEKTVVPEIIKEISIENSITEAPAEINFDADFFTNKEEPATDKVSTIIKKEVDIEKPDSIKIETTQNPIQAAQIKKGPLNSEEHMKVANYKIDHLVDMIGELIINQSLLEQHIQSNYSNDNQLNVEMSSFLRSTRELQNLSMSLRMVSFKPTFQKISRIARDTIQELKKDVEFVISGESTEIDRIVTDKLLDPLVHLIKNAISHGVEENSKDRIKNNKPAKAKVELNAFSKRGKIYIQVIDDGRGIDTNIVHKKAIEKGLIDPNQAYTDDEIREFILLPGFSTAAQIDNISGRGVGMDVVKTQITKLGGKVDIKSNIGKGSTFTLEVPVNHAIMNGTVIQMREHNFIIPTINVKEILLPQENQWVSTQGKRTMINVRNNIIPIVPLSFLFENSNPSQEDKLVMLIELDQELRALPITNVVTRQEVVVKPVGQEFVNLNYISGMSILGNGRVSLILDIDYLFKKEVKA